MKKNVLWAVSIIVDIAILIGAIVIVNMVWPEDSWHRLVYYVCGAGFGGYVVFRYRQLKELLQ